MTGLDKLYALSGAVAANCLWTRLASRYYDYHRGLGGRSAGCCAGRECFIGRGLSSFEGPPAQAKFKGRAAVGWRASGPRKTGWDRLRERPARSDD